MINPQVIRKMARDTSRPLDMMEKDYVLGWILYGISKSPIAGKMAFKGGTAISKVYFPLDWRLSEDLDFTVSHANSKWSEFLSEIRENIPAAVFEKSGIEVKDRPIPMRNTCNANSNTRAHTAGAESEPTLPSRMRLGPQRQSGSQIPKEYDYADFSINTYTPENIFAEKLRAIIQRGKMRDYYDVWRLLREGRVTGFDRELFLKKCKSRNIGYVGIGQFFPDGKEEELENFKDDMARMTSDTIDIPVIFSELRNDLGRINL